MRKYGNRKPRIVARLLAALLVVGMVSPGRGAPSDVFESAAPMLGSDPPKAEALRDGDSSVSTQTGSFNYSYPITVPPGRQGNEPSLALSYSSQGANYGGIAAGWSLSIPEIRRDTSGGILDQIDGTQITRAGMRFVSSLAGSRPLIETDEPKASNVYKTFRAQNDTSYARYEWMNQGHPFEWRVLFPDGRKLYFGDAALITNNWVTDLRSPLTRSVDAFDNTVEYEWSVGSNVDYRIDEIRYTSNPTAGLPAFARVTFAWTPMAQCPDLAVGASRSHRAGRAEDSGADKLTKITATAFDPDTQAVLHTREVNLAYDWKSEDCTEGFAPIRLLTSIQESAWHAGQPHVDLPPVTFSYGPLGRPTWEPAFVEGWPTPLEEQNAVTWGKRFDTARWPTVEAMMIDLDGDGRVDRLVSNKSGGCYANWYKNTVDGFVPKTTIPLPNLPYGSLVPGEGCSLNYQRTNYINNDPGVCVGGNQADTMLVYRWMDVTGDSLPDLVTAIHHNWAAYEITKGCFEPVTSECIEPFGPWPTCTDDHACPVVDTECVDAATQQCGEGFCLDASFEVCMDSAVEVGCDAMFSGSAGSGWCGQPICVGQPRECPRLVIPQELCGRYPWMVYENLGDGQFAGLAFGNQPQPKWVMSPVPLESDSGESPSGGGGYTSGRHAVMDMDGDGFMDVAGKPKTFNDACALVWAPFWYVWKGDGTGDFHTAEDGEPHIWQVEPSAAPSASGLEYQGPMNPFEMEQTAMSLASLVDLNGDGLPDLHWQDYDAQTGVDPEVKVLWNLGYRFGQPEVFGGSAITGLSRTWMEATEVNDFPTDGFADSRTRLLDYDGDGRTDLLSSTRDAAGTWSPFVLMFNTGANFGAAFTPPPDAVTAMFQRSEAYPWSQEYRWRRLHDFVDIDGDGVAEYVSRPFGQDDLWVIRNPLTATPPRLLATIDNGQGLEVSVEYAPLADPSVVTSYAEVGKASPSVQWVVKSLTTTDDFEASASTSTYHYTAPVWSPDDDGKWGFRGFDTVRTTNPHGAVTEERYDYAVDWSGRLESTLVFPTEGGGDNPSSIVDQTWQRYTLFDQAIEIFHPRITSTYTCTAEQDEGACRSGLMRREETAWTALSLNGVPQLYAATTQYLQDSLAFDAGDRYTSTSYELHAPDVDTYRLRATETVSTWLNDVTSQFETYARTQTFWDPTYRVAETERLYFSEATGDYADTRRTYDMQTGNVLTRTKPEQLLKTGQPHTTHTYDSRRLFVATTTNEVGHEVDTVYDYGTGALLRTIGPNGYYCPSCPKPREEKKTDIDGLGRAIATWISRDTGAGYLLTKVGETSYVDTPVGTTPTSVTTKSLINYDGTPAWTEQTTELDGHGRPIETTVVGTLPSVTTYDYDEAGDLVAVTVPDPSQTSGAYVTYNYGFDSIGRPTSMRRPGVTTGDETGIDLAYNGTTHTRSEVAGAAGGPAATTVLYHDAFGRLTAVDELITGTTYATTTYAYDPRDAVGFIDDPDGVATTLTHDWAGRRERIERGSTRVWQYAYDKNGNLESEISPVPGGQPESLYTTSFAYDDLDRLTSKLIAQRDLTSGTGGDLNHFGIDQIVHHYDDATPGANRIGRLYRVETRGPSGPTIVDKSFRYDGEGNTTEDLLVYNLAGISGARRVKTAYWPGGKVREVDYGDGPQTEPYWTRARFDYDERGNPLEVNLGQNGGTISTFDWVRYARNAAGLVTSRTKPQLGPFGYPQVASWQYDKLGRVVDQRVLTGPAGYETWVAAQQLTYWGTDDPKTLVHFASGVTTQNFTFAYDDRHQLTEATTSSGSFTSTYAFTAGGRLDHVRVDYPSPPATSDVEPRDVDYVYAGTDPEMLGALRAGGIDWATYAYDAAGNTTSRTYRNPSGDETTSFLWDGDDQLRRATKGSSREEYFYDHTGQRIGVVKRTQSGASWLVSQVKIFHGPTEIWHIPSGGVTNRFANITLGTPVARVESTTGNGVLELQYHSTLQSLLVALAPNNTVKAAFSYGPYGETLQHAPTSQSTRLRRYNDKHKDELSGLYYYGYRYYDNVSLTWTSADPLYRFVPDAAWNEPRRAALYTFNLGNPLAHVDPDGREGFPVTIDQLGEMIFDGAGPAITSAIKSGAKKAVDVATDPEVIKAAIVLGAGAATAGSGGWGAAVASAVLYGKDEGTALGAMALGPLGGRAKVADDALGAVDDVARGTGSLKEKANSIREAGTHRAARNNRTIAVGEDSAGNLHAGSSNGFDKGQRAATDAMGIKRVPSRRGTHAEEDLMEAVPDLKKVGTSKRAPCGSSEHDCAGKLRDRGVEVE